MEMVKTSVFLETNAISLVQASITNLQRNVPLDDIS